MKLPDGRIYKSLVIAVIPGLVYSIFADHKFQVLSFSGRVQDTLRSHSQYHRDRRIAPKNHRIPNHVVLQLHFWCSFRSQL